VAAGAGVGTALLPRLGEPGALLAQAPSAGSVPVLVGTQGGPVINLGRGEAASDVVVGGRPYLMDCGYGTLRALLQAGLRSWTWDRVSHPPAQRPHVGRRRAAVAPMDRVAPPVRAIENMHYPDVARARMAHRSLASRFDMADRSIVFSGDTAPSSNLVELARNADILVCEAIDVAQHRQLMADTHSTTEEVRRMAAVARVKTVVLNHLVPGSNPARGEIPDMACIAGVRKYFDGQVIVGRDQMKP
jgi:ribonuclease BN (tRNA processing enzyme)